MALALARKYRPKRFADIAVQSHVSATLQGAIARGRVAHGYLLCGPRGVGKTTLARVLAMALNCERRAEPSLAGEPCGECASCGRIWAGSASLDVVEIDAASNRGVDDARDLRERALYAPSGPDRYKVYIVDEAHMLTREAWNALLKILEEPPPRVVFVFATTEPQKIAQTAAPVLSRLQRFDLRRIGPAELRARLAYVLDEEGVEVDTDGLTMIARAADGSMRDALSLADQVLAMGEGRLTAARVSEALGLVPEDEYLALLGLILEHRAADVFPAVARLADAGADLGAVLAGVGAILRAQLAVVLGASAPVDVSERARQTLGQRKAVVSASDLLRMLAAVGDLEPRFRKSGQQQMLLETLLVRLAVLDRSVALEEVVRSIGGGAGGPGGGASGARMAPVEAPRPGGAEHRAEDSGSASGGGRPRMATEPSGAARAPTVATVAGAAPRPSTALVAERWDTVIGRLREAGRGMLANALQGATPGTVSATGVVTLLLEEANDFVMQKLEAGRDEVVAAIAATIGPVTGIDIEPRPASALPGAAPSPRRLTDEALRRERVAAMRRKDAVLGAAIDALDLEVLD